MKKLSSSELKRVHNSLYYILNFMKVNNIEKLDIYPPLRIEIAIELIIEDLLSEESVSDITKRGCIKNSIERYIKYKKYQNVTSVVESFQKACDVELRKMRKRFAKYSILMFLNTNPINTFNFREFKILGTTLRLLHWGEINYLDIDDAWQRLKIEIRQKNPRSVLDDFWSLPILSTCLPVVTEIYAIDIATAIESAIEKFNLFRCFFNVPLVLENNEQSQNDFRKLSQVKPSPYHIIFDDTGKFLKLYSTIENYDYKTNYPSKNQIEVVNHFLPKFPHPLNPKSSVEHFRIVLLLYQKALDTNDFSASFLAFWRVLEKSVTFGKEKISNEEISKRISHLCFFDFLIDDILLKVVDSRNKFVHLGEYPELAENHKIHAILRVLATHTLNELYKLVQKYPKRNQIYKYIEFVGKDEAEISRTKSILDDIIVKKFT